MVVYPAERGSPLAKRGQNVTAAYKLNYVNGTFIEGDDEFAFVLGEGHGERGDIWVVQLCVHGIAMHRNAPGSFQA